MWMHHLVNLLFTAASMVPTAIGSTWLGILFPLWVFIVTEIVTGFFLGWQTLKAWLTNIRIGLATAFIAWSALFIFCVVGAVYTDHIHLVERSRQYKTDLTNKDQEITHVEREDLEKYTDLRVSCAGIAAGREQLQSQNRDQQSTINNCQTQAINLLTPVALHIEPVKLASEPRITQSTYILLTNKPIFPVSVTTVCSSDINHIALGPAAETSFTIGAQTSWTSHRAAITKFDGPAWTPIFPLIATVTFEKSVGTCDFSD